MSMRFWSMLGVIILVTGLLLVGPAAAQDGLDYTQAPLHGEIALITDFVDDPHQVTFAAGGSVSVADSLGGSCDGYATGFVNAAPDYRLHFTAGEYLLAVMFAGAGDTSIVINAPDGNWYCDGDSGGLLQPYHYWNEPVSGQYDIWVGSPEPNKPVNGMLLITEIDFLPAEEFADQVVLPPTKMEAGMLPLTAPSYGSVTLTSGYEDDPHFIYATGGGPLDVAAALGSVCQGTAIGYVSSKPTYHINYTAGDYPLTIFNYSLDDGDTTLVVRAPDGTWYCDDDSAGLMQPAVTFNNPQSGEYYAWVGSYTTDVYDEGVLLVTEVEGYLAQNVADELASADEGQGVGGGMDLALAPAYGMVELAAGFQPDPQTLEMVAGGAVSMADAIGGVCSGAAGYVAAAPDYSVSYAAGTVPLRIFFASTDGVSDTTLAVSAPDGSWYCNDDFGSTLDGMVEFTAPVAGQYNIWVGSYTESEFVDGTLYVTEQALDPASVRVPSK